MTVGIRSQLLVPQTPVVDFPIYAQFSIISLQQNVNSRQILVSQGQPPTSLMRLTSSPETSSQFQNHASWSAANTHVSMKALSSSGSGFRVDDRSAWASESQLTFHFALFCIIILLMFLKYQKIFHIYFRLVEFTSYSSQKGGGGYLPVGSDSKHSRAHLLHQELFLITIEDGNNHYECTLKFSWHEFCKHEFWRNISINRCLAKTLRFVYVEIRRIFMSH